MYSCRDSISKTPAGKARKFFVTILKKRKNIWKIRKKGIILQTDSVRGLKKFLTCFSNTDRMIDKNLVKSLVDEWLENQDYFLTDVTVSPDNRIVVEIDHKEGVWIEDCVELSRFIESRLDRDAEDFELEVGSAGIGQPFKVLQQYVNHVGENVEVLTGEGRKLTGVLKEATPEHFTLTIREKVKEEGAKRPKLVDRDLTFAYDEVKWTKYLIDFK